MIDVNVVHLMNMLQRRPFELMLQLAQENQDGSNSGRKFKGTKRWVLHFGCLALHYIIQVGWVEGKLENNKTTRERGK